MIAQIDLSQSKLQEISGSLGATDCQYFACDHPDLGKLFIKSGEKVGIEIQNYTVIVNEINAAYILTPLGTLDSETIVLPYADDAGMGFRMVDLLWEYPQSIGEFINFQENAFNALCSLYLHTSEAHSCPRSSKMFGQRVFERVNALQELNDREVLGPDSRKVKVSSLLENSIPCEDSTKLPSINEMVRRLSNELHEQYAYPSCRIHADPQPSNFLEHQGEVKVADLSDLRAREDLSWDIAKWMNYVARFHRVVKARGSGGHPSAQHQAAELPAESQELVRSALLQQISETMKIDRERLDLRSRVGEFVVNVNTLRRHLLKFPQVSPMVIQAIGRSYLNAINYVENS